jgi:primosomal protein N' (replication factor Y)
MNLTVEVAVAMPVHGTFTYRVEGESDPAALTGMRVLVPFGRRRATGFILGPGSPPPGKDLKPITKLLGDGPIFPPEMIPLFRWTADYYKHPLGDVIQTALPGGLTLTDRHVYDLADPGRAALADSGSLPAERRVLELLTDGPRSEGALRRAAGPAAPAIRLLERRGCIQRRPVLHGGSAKPRQERWVRARAEGGAVYELTPKKRSVFEELVRAGELPVRELERRIPNASAHLRALCEAGRTELFARRGYRDPFGETILPDIPPVLTDDQERVVAAVCGALGRGFRTFLLSGVTGSGKTEVYMRVAGRALAEGRSVLVLVPEIALISQMERRFRARFGECVAILHSGLSEGERFDQWSRVVQGQVRIAIGARSAVFAPFAELSLVIVDEEHDASYKQEGGLHYNARDLALVRAQQLQAVALLGSATPALASLHAVRAGKYEELKLPRRVEDRPLPEVRVVDLRACRDLRGPGRFITAELNRAMRETLERGEQVLLFLNRRGYATFPVCGACGHALNCRHCDISLTLHQALNAYVCHYCGHSRPLTAVCDRCGSAKIQKLGLGTEKVEAAVRALFPAARVARMDRDTTRRKGEIVAILKALRTHTVDVLVGTQMVAKGHDFPDITLVGIICADLSLSFPDFRAGERTFQLLAQVAGRAGRGERPGQVILQTYSPEHFTIRAARDQDVTAFYEQEIGHRRGLGYPPFTRLAQLRIADRERSQAREAAFALAERCRALVAAAPAGSIQVMGPIEAALSRVAGMYRWQILLKSGTTGALHRMLEALLADCPHVFTSTSPRVVLDVDPLYFM